MSGEVRARSVQSGETGPTPPALKIQNITANPESSQEPDTFTKLLLRVNMKKAAGPDN